MAEGMMNPNTQEQLMLVQSFEQLANAVGAEIPVSIDSEMAAVKNGMRMSEDLQRILAEGSMQFMNQLRPDQIGDMSQGTGAALTADETTGAAMTEEERMPMQNKMPSQDGMTYGPSSGVTVAPSNVMSLDDAIAAGLVNPTRPRARPTAPMTSVRPQMRR